MNPLLSESEAHGEDPHRAFDDDIEALRLGLSDGLLNPATGSRPEPAGFSFHMPRRTPPASPGGSCAIKCRPCLITSEVMINSKQYWEGIRSMTDYIHDNFLLESWKYSDQKFFKIEVQNVFYDQWLYVAHETQLENSGSYVALDILDKPIFIIRDDSNRIRCFYNVCVHRGHILLQESGIRKAIICPYHAWSFRPDGALIAVPGLTLDDIDTCHKHLREVRIESWRGFLFVHFGTPASGLTEYFEEVFSGIEASVPYIDRLTFSQRITHDVDGNWKILVDNYLECYHCVPNHPSFVDLMAVKQYDIKTFSNFSIHTAPAGRPDNLAYHIDPTLYNHPRFDGWYLWPNLTLNVFPGTENLLIFHTIPVSADRCIGYCDYFFPDDTVNEQAKHLIPYFPDARDI